MKKFQILFMDAHDDVVEANSYDSIFSTIGIKNEVIDNAVNIWNETGGVGCLGSGGTLDEYLLNEEKITTDDMEVILNSLAEYATRTARGEEIKKVKVEAIIKVKALIDEVNGLLLTTTEELILLNKQRDSRVADIAKLTNLKAALKKFWIR